MRRVPVRLLALALMLVLGASHPASSGGADDIEEPPLWVVVRPAAYRAAMAPLVRHREAAGFEVVVAEPTRTLLPDLLEILREHGGQERYVLLAGAMRGPASRLVPAPEGTVGRMKGHPSDNGYGCLDDDLLPDVAVGRFPARTPEEVQIMVEKTLRAERAAPDGLVPESPSAGRINLIVGNPGGTTRIERRFAARVVENAVSGSSRDLDPRWTLRTLVQVEASPFRVPESELAATARRWVEEAHFLTIYLGHSSAGGLVSEHTRFLRRDDWKGLKRSGGAGLFFTCGCYACQFHGILDEGYAYAAMRAPGGPSAVIGAHLESYGVMGKLAVEGLLTCLRSSAPPPRLGDWWLAVKRGIAEGRVGPLTFLLYDRADGSGGRVPLAEQRREHLEMWTLLGDPALRLPIPRHS